jgi:hypothetical protein
MGCASFWQRAANASAGFNCESWERRWSGEGEGGTNPIGFRTNPVDAGRRLPGELLVTSYKEEHLLPTR